MASGLLAGAGGASAATARAAAAAATGPSCSAAYSVQTEVDIATAFGTFAQLLPAAAPPSGFSAA
jgi:hypothetical protein